MRPLTKSITWRLQFWHGAILLFVGLGLSTGWILQTRRAVLGEVDAELLSAARVLDGSLRGFRLDDYSQGRRYLDRGLSPDEDRRLSLPARDGESECAPYLAIWLHDGRMLKSERLHEGSVDFDDSLRGKNYRVSQRANLRELRLVGPFDSQVLVGRDISAELGQLNRLIARIAAFAIGILAAGLAGGWWLARAVLRPISDMSNTASQFSAVDMSPRIDVVETESELGELAMILNAAFDRVESAFDQQKQFAADASHELRTPLAMIQAQIELALRKDREPAEYVRTLTNCATASDRLSELVSSLLTLARLDSGEHQSEYTPVRLDLIVAKCTDMMRPIAERADVTLATEIEPVSVSGDAKQLEHAFLNLLKNAIAYNRPDGSVNLVVRLDGKLAEAIVQDSGIGISNEDLPHITERFYRADKARSRHHGGSGLGLSIVNQIVAAHGGSLTISSTPGDGTNVAVRLEALDEKECRNS